MLKADYIINGTIYPHSGSPLSVRSIAVGSGQILAAGSISDIQDYQAADTAIITLKENQIITPSYAEGHAHISGNTEIICDITLYEQKTIEDYQQIIKDYLAHSPGCSFVRGGGWINGAFPNGIPAKDYLDAVCPDIPVALASEDHHSYWFNTKAMELANITSCTVPPLGGIIETYPGTDIPCGCVRENAQSTIRNIIPPYTLDEYKRAILDYQEKALSYGITASFEPLLLSPLRALEAYRVLEEEGHLKIHFSIGYPFLDGDNADTVLDTLSKEKKISDSEHVSLNTVKFFIDGVIEGHTAYLLEPYHDTPESCGAGLWEQNALNSAFLRCERLGYNIHVHAIGDAAVHQTLDAFFYVREKNGPTSLRHAITHLQLVAPDDRKRMTDLKIMGVVNPYWHFKNPEYHDTLEIPYLGHKRADLQYPLGSLHREGVMLITGSDYPVTIDPNPFMSLSIGATRKHPQLTALPPLGENEALTVPQMMETLTNGFFQQHLEHRCGSLVPGNSADFVILDRDIYHIPVSEIHKTKVLKTFTGGKCIFSRCE